MRTTWEKLTQYVGTTYGQDISNELQNKTTVVLPEPEYEQATIDRHTARTAVVRSGEARILAAREQQQTILEAAVAAATDDEAPMKLALLQNEMEQAALDAMEDVPMVLTDAEKTAFSNAWRTYRERNGNLEKNRGQAFSLILGQCTQLLQDKMKQDADWAAASTSYDPLTLYRLIEKTILAQTEDQYPFATVYDQERAFYSFQQDNLTNAQWYERFNTKIDVSEAIGVTHQHKILLEFVAKETFNTEYANIFNADDAKAVREDAEERYISYVFLRQSSKNHATLRAELSNDFTKGDNQYPRTRQQTLHLLDNYTTNKITTTVEKSEGVAFAQKGKQGKQKPYDKKYWKDKECYNCGEKGHPSSHCKEPKKQDDDDDKSLASTTSVKKLKKELKSVNKKLDTVNTQLSQLKEDDSDISDSDDDEEASHFQYDAFQFEKAFQFTQVAGFEPKIAALFKQSDKRESLQTLDLREVFLLDSQSTTDLICNEKYAETTFDDGNSMKLTSNGGSMRITHKCTVRQSIPQRNRYQDNCRTRKSIQG